MIQCVRRSSRNVRLWQNGEMCLCWTGAGMLDCEQQFRRVIGTTTSPSSALPSSEKSLVSGPTLFRPE